MPVLPDFETFAQRMLALKRFVLLAGDAGVVIVRLSGRRIEAHEFLAGSLGNNSARVKLALAEFPEIPVVVLFDVLGLAFRRDRVPPVNLFDRPKIIARRLEALFPGTELKGGCRLGVAQGEARGFDYLFAAVTASPEIAEWRKFLENIGNPVSDVRLLPVESVKLLQRLTALAPSGEARPGRWGILISQHRSGGFRQIVTDNGRLSIARMTSGFVDTDSPREITSLLQHEIGATIDYITRLGFDRAEGLDAVFIGRREVCAALRAAQLPVRRLTALSPAEAGSLAGLSGAGEESGHFADLVHAAWGGGRLLPALSVWPAPKRRQRRQTLAQIWGARALAAASVAGLLYGANLMREIQAAQAQNVQAEAARGALQRDYDARVTRQNAGPVAISRIQDINALSDQLEARTVDLPALFAALNGAMSKEVRLRSLSVKINYPAPVLPPALAPQNQVAEPAEDMKIEGKIVLALDLSPFRLAAPAVDEAERLAAALRRALPDMRTSIVRQPLNILPTDTLTVKPGENILALTGARHEAEIEISGNLK